MWPIAGHGGRTPDAATVVWKDMKAKVILVVAFLCVLAGKAWGTDVTLSEDPEIPEGTAGHWYVNMPRMDKYTLMLSASNLNQGMNVFKVYDDGGKNGNYSKNCNSKLIINVPSGYVIQVSGIVWTGREVPGVMGTAYLRVYDGNTEDNRLAKVNSPSDGEARGFGPVTSTGTDMCLSFNSFSDYSYQGLDLTVTVYENVLYNVSVATGIEHGTVVASPTTAHPYDDITLTVTPAANYHIGTVSYNDGSDHVIMPENDVYSFKMPQHNVTVSATFLDDVAYHWGVGNDGSEEHPYVIRNKAGWDLLVTETQSDVISYLINDKYFRLDADINDVTIGLDVFDGHLDGNHHKITLVGVTDGFVHHSYNATFSDLTIEGTVNTENSKRYVMYNVVNTNTNLTNCLFNVSSSAGYGLKGLASSGFTCTNCALLLDGNATFVSGGAVLTSAYAVVFNAGAFAVRTGGIAIGNGDATLYTDGFSYGGTEYYQENATVVLGCNHPSGYSVTGYSVSGATLGEGNSFTMPNHGVTVTATGLVANHFDTDGTEQTHDVSLLSSSEEAVTKPGGWYAVFDDVTFSQGLTFSSDAYLLLPDGVTMTAERGITIADGGTLTVDGSGSLVVTGTQGTPGESTDLESAQQGGRGGDGGVGISGSLIVNGCTVNVAGGAGGTGGQAQYGGNGGNGGAGISGSLTVNGGTVDVSGGSGGASGYGPTSWGKSGGKGKAFGGIVTCIAGYIIQENGNGNWTNVASGSTCSSQMLRVMGIDNMTLTARQAVFSGQTRYWSTFYHPDYSYLLPFGAQAFTMGSDHALYRIGDGSIVPAGCAVVIMSDSASLTLTAISAAVPSVTGNILRGTAAATTKLSVYVMSQANGAFGFFEFTGEIPANKAYYVAL